MYSESPSKDCFPFNDQSSSDDMPGMNDINNPTNLDYIFDSYYSSTSRCNTGFELPEDCKNMSFSELFDQELFSSQENKDCKVPIKIEKEEEPLQPCYSTDITQDITNNYPLTQIEENVPSPLLAKRFTPKRGINRTSIKSTNNYDVQRLIYHPFCETEDLSIDQPLVNMKLPIIKCEPQDAEDYVEQNMVDLQGKLCHSDNSQNTASDLGFNKVVDNGSYSLFKCSTLKHQGIKRTFIKTNRKSDIQQLMYNPFGETEDLIIKRPFMKMQVPIIKLEPEVVNDAVEQNIVDVQSKTCHIDDLQKTTGQHLIKIDRRSSSLSKNCNVDHFVHCKTAESLGINQTPALVNMRVVKQEPEDFNNTVEQNIVGGRSYYSEDSQNKANGLGFNKVVDNNSTSLFLSSSPKRQSIKRTFIKTNRMCDVQHLMDNPFSETKNVIIKQPLMKIQVPFVKPEPEDVNDAVEQNVVRLKGEPCFDNSQNIANIHGFVNDTDLVLKHQIINGTFLKNINKCRVSKNIFSPYCKTQRIGIDQMSVKVESPIVKCEPQSGADAIEQNNIKMDIVTEDKRQNEFGCIDLNNTNADKKDIVIIKGQDIMSNRISLKNDNVSSQTFKISNQINLENEKKKISWEEFRAKKGKLGYFKKFGNNGKSSASEIIIDDDKMEAMMKEFDRNTAIYLGQVKNVENKEQNINAKKVRNVEDEELEKNRMKIEYIKKLLPSSFASEIAKTSSLMKGNLVEEIENEITSDDSVMSSDKIKAKYTNSAYLKKDDKLQKKDHLSRIHLSRRSSSNKSSRSSSTSSSNPDDYYNHNRVHNTVQQDLLQYGKNLRNNTVQRSQEQKKVVYVGQIPIRFGKRYLYNRFKEFGQIQSLTLHKKPDFRVYYAFVTYSEYSEALRAISHGNHDQSQVQFDIRFGERKQAQTPYYDLDDEWLTDWYGYNNQPLAVVRKPQSHERDASFEEELQEFYKLAQIKKSKKIKSSQVS